MNRRVIWPVSQQLVQQTTSSPAIAALLDKHIKDKTIAVDGAPETMLHSGDADDDFVEPSAISVTCSAQKNAGTTSKQMDMRPIKSPML